jgi:hypothetical protein
MESQSAPQMSAISQRMNGFTNLDPKLPKRIITKGEKIIFTLLIGCNDHNTVLEARGRTKDLMEKVKTLRDVPIRGNISVFVSSRPHLLIQEVGHLRGHVQLLFTCWMSALTLSV